MNNSCNICSNSCVGISGHNGQCCSIDNREWILGPHQPDDISEFLNKLGNGLKYEDVFIDYEEGRKIFPNKKTWTRSENYPSLRVKFETDRKFCIFYDEDKRLCSVYDIRPKICKNYFCNYLKENTLSSSNG